VQKYAFLSLCYYSKKTIKNKRREYLYRVKNMGSKLRIQTHQKMSIYTTNWITLTESIAIDRVTIIRSTVVKLYYYWSHIYSLNLKYYHNIIFKLKKKNLNCVYKEKVRQKAYIVDFYIILFYLNNSRSQQ
jgi:hypothetical protein